MALLLPDPIRKARLQDIQKRLLDHKEEGHVGQLGRAVSLMLQERDFARHIAATPALRDQITGEASLMKLAWAFLYLQLNTQDLVAAAAVLFDEETFTAEPECVRLVWNAMMTERMIIVLGGGAMGKTYSICAFYLLAWLTDPPWTRVQLASASKDHLEKNALGDMFRLYAGASMALPGKADTVSISLEKKRSQGIFSLILPLGANSKAKLKGSHPKARPMHPRFGRRSRIFCLVDEGQETAQNIYDEIPNRFSAVDGDDVEHQKFAVTANAKDIFSQFGLSAKPKGGWESIQRSTKTWRSAKNWLVISLDAMEHENVKQRRIVFPGFVTWQGVQERLAACNGNWDDPRMWTYVLGKFPPNGLASSIIKQIHLTAAEKEWVFDGETRAIGGEDPAFTGDRPTFAAGRVGRAIGWIDSSGDRHMLPEPIWAIQADSVTVLPRGETQHLVDESFDRIKPLGIQPECFAIDKTGSGQGVHDIIRSQWAQKVGPINGRVDAVADICGITFGSSPTLFKIAQEDTQTPKEMFDIIASELWWAAAKLFEFGVIALGRGISLEVYAELAGRQGGMEPGKGKKMTTESKAEYKRRTGQPSCDLADALLVMLHVGRITTPGLIPRAKDTAPPPRELPRRLWGQESENGTFDTTPMEGFAPDAFADCMKD